MHAMISQIEISSKNGVWKIACLPEEGGSGFFHTIHTNLKMGEGFKHYIPHCKTIGANMLAKFLGISLSKDFLVEQQHEQLTSNKRHESKSFSTATMKIQ